MDFIFQITILIFSIVIHEVAHGYAAYMLGDSTAKYQGRLTMNPIKHLDPFGSVFLPLILFVTGSGFLIGWAKPVPYNPYNLRNQRWGEAIVAFAGPLSNIAIAVVFGLLLRIGVTTGLIQSVEILQITSYIVFINLLLAIFNLIPIPPLDGSKILFNIFQIGFSPVRIFLERYGIIIVLFFVFFLWSFVFPVVSKVFILLTGLYI
jgi:Zn-dependent protease